MIMHCCSALKDKLRNERCFVILFCVSDIFAKYTWVIEFAYTRIHYYFTSNALLEDPSLIDFYPVETSRKSNLSSVPQGYVDAYST
jgi:hypothetical protein